MSALESHLADGNLTNIFSPVNDQFLQPQNRFLGDNPKDLLRNKRFFDPSVSFIISHNQS